MARVEEIAHVAEGVRADAKTCVLVRDPEQRAIRRAQQFVLVHEFEPRVEIVAVEKVDGRLARVAIKV